MSNITPLQADFLQRIAYISFASALVLGDPAFKTIASIASLSIAASFWSQFKDRVYQKAVNGLSDRVDFVYAVSGLALFAGWVGNTINDTVQCFLSSSSS